MKCHWCCSQNIHIQAKIWQTDISLWW